MLKCENCNKEFKSRNSKNANRFCSSACYWESKKGKPSSNPKGLDAGRGWNKGRPADWAKGEKNSQWRGGKVTLVCKWCGNQYEVLLNRKDKSTYCSRHCAGKDRFGGKKHPMYGKSRDDMSGENNPNWNGGNSRDYKSHYNSFEYRNWRQQVFERDNYTCQECGVRGDYMEAHHKIGWSEDESQRYNVDNGIALCRECHIKLDHHRARFVKGDES